jgi:hypothetical protein
MITSDPPRTDVPDLAGWSGAWRRHRWPSLAGPKPSLRLDVAPIRLASVALFAAVAFCQTTVATPPTQVSPPVDPHAPYTTKVLSLMAAMTLDEKLSLSYGATDTSTPLIGNVGFLPGVPRLGVPPRRDADALGIEVVADATALPARLGLGATFDRQAIYSAGQ